MTDGREARATATARTVILTLVGVMTISSVVLAASAILAARPGAVEEDFDLQLARVEQGVLVDRLEVEVQEASIASVELSIGSGADPIVTWTAGSGATVRAGARVLEVAGVSIVALPGELPMYRDLRVGMIGPDVHQLQSALRGLGYSVRDTDGYFGWPTARGVLELFSDSGGSVRDASGRPFTSANAGLMTITRGMLAFLPSFPAVLSSDCGVKGAVLGEADCFLSTVERELLANVPDSAGLTDETEYVVEMRLSNGEEVQGILEAPVSSPILGAASADEAAPDEGADRRWRPISIDDGSEELARSDILSAQVIVATSQPSSLLVPSLAVRTGDGQNYWLERVSDGTSVSDRVLLEIDMCIAGTCAVRATELFAGDEVVVGYEF